MSLYVTWTSEQMDAAQRLDITIIAAYGLIAQTLLQQRSNKVQMTDGEF